ncbi:class I SAM-dependent methyltransferase [Candidatus Methylomirabilis sp.]|uniref:class I SAM-dependent methyltransferase n=1 Tax=Candidatus Methylomirabilis sp. TaxID=2032687 RepID=UPI002A64D115|nr:class I SAM-dependent methyltransferase [Candidatus Methylomirabilis sp.]
MSLVVDEHRAYLADQARMSAFCKAIGETVKPGDVVLDLGSGTGILGLFACRAGATRVYSIEEGGMVELARAICRANGFHDRVTFIKGLSTRVELPERVDVVVADQIGRFGFEAGLPEYFDDARRRFLKPDGRLLPSCVEMWVAPVECPEMFAQVEFWNDSPAGFDFRPARSWAANTGYPVKLRADHLLSDPVSAALLDLSITIPTPLTLEASVLATRAGNLHGIGGWFSARLSNSVTMSNSPLATHSINRRNVFFPVDRPVGLEKGDRVRIKMQILPSELVITWEVEVWGMADARKARFTHSTFHGMLICKEDLERTQPHFIPKLSPWGDARRSILNLCDSQRTLAEIEQEIYSHYPELFRSLGEAAAFVAEVITRYSL